MTHLWRRTNDAVLALAAHDPGPLMIRCYGDVDWRVVELKAHFVSPFIATLRLYDSRARKGFTLMLPIDALDKRDFSRLRARLNAHPDWD